MSGCSVELWGGGHGGHQADAVHYGGQLLDDRGMGIAGTPGQVPRLLPALGPSCWPFLKRAATVIGCDVNKLVKSSLHPKVVRI